MALIFFKFFLKFYSFTSTLLFTVFIFAYLFIYLFYYIQKITWKERKENKYTSVQGYRRKREKNRNKETKWLHKQYTPGPGCSKQG